MIQTKLLKRLVVVLIIIVGFIAARQLVPSMMTTNIPKSYATYVKSLDIDSISKIMISRLDDEFMFTKKDGAWLLDEWLVNEATVRQLLAGVIDPAKVELIAETNARHEALGVGESGIRVVLTQGEDEYVLTIGDRVLSSHYAKLLNTDEVYLVPDLPLSANPFLLSEWVDLTVISMEENMINSIKVVEGDDSIEIVRTDDKWYLSEDNRPIARTSVSQLIVALESLTANGIVEEEEVRAGYAINPNTVIEIAKDNQTVIVQLFEGEFDYLLTTNTRIGEYIISTSVANSMRLAQDALVFEE